MIKLFLHFFSWNPFITWSVRLGPIFFALALLAKFLNADILSYKMLSFAWNFTLVLPYMWLPGYFRTIISNQRLGLIPGFYFKTGIVMLLITLIFSVTLQLSATLLNLESVAAGLSPLFFAAATLYFGYLQLTITSKHIPFFLAFGAISFCVCTLYFIANGLQSSLENMMWYLALIALLCWCYGLYILSTRSIFKPVFNVFAGEKNIQSFDRLWKSHDRHPQSSTPEGTLLLGVPDGYRALLITGAMWILIFPICTALTFTIFDFLLPGDGFPPFAWTFLAGSTFLGGWSTLANGELTARARLLWLRYGTDRIMIWNHLEKVAFRSWLGIYFWAICTAVIFAIFQVFDNILIINYLLFIMVLSVFLLYLSMMSRITQWPILTKGLALLLSIALPIFLVFKSISTENYLILYLFELALLTLATGLRHIARNSFLGIDWMQIKIFNPGRASQA